MLAKTQDHVTTIFSAVRKQVEQARASLNAVEFANDANALIHGYDTLLFKSVPNSLADLINSRILSIIQNRKR